AHGQNFARWQMDGWRNNAETARGMGRSPEIWPGRRIVLTGHPQPAARKGDKLECSAAIVEGSPDVFIGGEQVTYPAGG
ncbi:hypothetical protein BOZ37_004680, partial [Escherichia coli]|nr:hypothetical protein [Escherichia coli]